MTENKINIEAILQKHIEESGFAADYEHYKKVFPKRTEVMKAAIKEIIETIIDKCADEAKLTLDATPYSDKEYIDKDSILQVKQLINYE